MNSAHMKYNVPVSPLSVISTKVTMDYRTITNKHPCKRSLYIESPRFPVQLRRLRPGNR